MTSSPIAEGSRFAPVTDNNHSGYLWITSILCLIYASLIIIVRLHIKWNMYGADDWTALVATVFQFGQVVPLFVAMNNGLGHSQHLLDPASIDTAGTATFISQVFLILSLSFAKGSVAALMLRLFTRDMKATQKSWIMCNVTVVLIGVWCIGSIIAISVSCTPSGFLRGFEQSCTHQVDRWRGITAFNIVIELLLMLLPVFFIWPIQMKRYIKLQVVVAFGFRLPVAALAAAHLHYVSDYERSADVSKAIIPALLYSQFELFWSLLAATIPTLKAFMRSFNSGFGMEIDLDGYGSGYGSGHGSRGGSYPLHSLQSASAPNGVVTSRTVTTKSSKSRKHGFDDETAISSRAAKDKLRPTASVTSDGSQELIIQREVQWSVYTEDLPTKNSTSTS